MKTFPLMLLGLLLLLGPMASSEPALFEQLFRMNCDGSYEIFGSSPAGWSLKVNLLLQVSRNCF